MTNHEKAMRRYEEVRRRFAVQAVNRNHESCQWYRSMFAEYGDAFYKRMTPWESGAKGTTRTLKIAERAGLFD